jgi:hypothetical protein
MRRLPPEAALSRPTLLDYFLLLGGCGLSLALGRLAPLKVEVNDNAAPPLRDLLPLLPDLLRLPEGIVLLWPLFYVLQHLFGRKQGLTSGEWLWVFAWVGTAALVALSVWKQSGNLPELLTSYSSIPVVVWYAVLVPSMAVIALVLALLGLLRWGPVPWTHNLALVLLLWPVPALAAILSFGKLA